MDSCFELDHQSGRQLGLVFKGAVAAQFLQPEDSQAASQCRGAGKREILRKHDAHLVGYLFVVFTIVGPDS
jgi:hypothetical protein